jgi:2-C-methyl-D-erythritol 4-phosphate cytidylyltransferase/2-C-methyl-D-erythritol 2,4-cyclodiphosphate synthase
MIPDEIAEENESMNDRGGFAVAVVVAAGKGTRMGTETPKQLLPYKGSTVLKMSLGAFTSHGSIDAAVLVVPADRSHSDEYEAVACEAEKRDGKPVRIVAGGRERGDSVRNGLAAADDLRSEKGFSREDTFVLIHDGARPEVTADIIDRNIEALGSFDAVCTAVPATDSMRERTNCGLLSEPIYPIINSKALNRDLLYNVQTPQSFRLDVILRAYDKAEKDGYTGTDDASVAEYSGFSIALVEGRYENIKVTTRKDIPMGIRVGTGYDVHRLAEGRRLILCGVPVPSSRGLLGHSDADVAAHALMDAILGAAGKGDIGQHFPDTDERYLGADSMELLRQTKEIAGAADIVNADITIIAEKPKLAPYIEEMRMKIADTLGMPGSAVNVKATTTEGLGFTGRGEGIAAIATCAIEGRF